MLFFMSTLRIPSHVQPGPQVNGAGWLGLYLAALASMVRTSSPSLEESLLDELLESLLFFFFCFLAFFGEDDWKVTQIK